jgi:hypothetical protein
MTRAQLAVVITKRFKLPLVSPAVPTFTDVPKTHYAYQYVEALYKAGYTNGCQAAPKKYCPETNTTRSQLAVMMAKGMGYSSWPSKTPTFLDVVVTNPAYGQIEYLVSKNIMAGCSATPSWFCPEIPLTRVDASNALSNSVEFYGF